MDEEITIQHMKKSIFSTLMTVLLVFAFSCTEEEIPTSSTPDPDPSSFTTTDVAVIVPPGSSIDLSKTTLLSGFAEYPVDSNGKSKIRFAPGMRRLTHLVDGDGNTLMMGFITNTTKEISIATTASVLVYWGLGLSILPQEVVHKYIEGYSTMEGMSDFIASISSDFSKNSKLVQSGGFEPALKQYLASFASTDSLDIRAKQIQVTPNGFKSGIQVYELDHQNVQIRNRYRRRTHAFAYKTAFKNKDGVETILKNRVGGTDVAEIDLGIKPTTAINSFTGTMKEWVIDKGAELAMTENGPVSLPLKDTESEATYKVRVVGPGTGNKGGLGLTSAERDKLEQLVVETFALDFVLPVIFDIVGMNDLTGFFAETDANGKANKFLTIITIVDNFIKASPIIEQLLQDGEYGQALKETIYLSYNEAGSAQFEDLVKRVSLEGLALMKGIKPDLVTQTAEEITKKSEKILKIFKYTDLILKGLDYNRLMAHIKLSDYNVEFVAIVKADDLVMTPKESTVVTQTNTTFKVETKTALADGESFVYKWSTTGKYGKLSYQNKKDVYFEASTGSMVYRAEAPAGDLSDGPNIDTVKVEVFTKKGTALTRIGDAKGVINVQKIKLVMKPTGITLSGGQNVALYLERTDGVNDIVSNAALDYKVEWETSGTYGKFNGTLKSATTMGNRINYEVLDKDVKEGTETFTARVYFKAKTDTEWVLREEVKGDLKIVNDPNKIIMNIPLSVKTWDLEPSTCNVGANFMVEVPVHPKAVRYEVTFYGFKNGWKDGTRGSWQAGKAPPVAYGFPGADAIQVVGGKYYYTISRSWGAGWNRDGCMETLQEWVAFYEKFGGMANVIITVTD
jgi:hypothetical protein